MANVKVSALSTLSGAAVSGNDLLLLTQTSNLVSRSLSISNARIAISNANDYVTYTILKNNLTAFANYANATFGTGGGGGGGSSASVTYIHSNYISSTSNSYYIGTTVTDANSVIVHLDGVYQNPTTYIVSNSLSNIQFLESSITSNTEIDIQSVILNSSIYDISYTYANYISTTANSYYTGGVVPNINSLNVYLDGVHQNPSSYVLDNSSSNIKFTAAALDAGSLLDIQTLNLNLVPVGIEEYRYVTDMYNINANIAASGGSIDGLSSDSVNTITLSTGYSFIPETDGLQDLGSSSNKFKTLYLSGNTLNLGSLALSQGPGESLLVSNSSGGRVPIVVSSISLGTPENPVTLSVSPGASYFTVTSGSGPNTVTSSSNVNAVQDNLTSYISYAASRFANVESNVTLLQNGLIGTNTIVATQQIALDNYIAFAGIRFGNVEANVLLVQSGLSSANASINGVQSNLSNHTAYANSRFSNVESNVTLLQLGLAGANTNIDGVQSNLNSYTNYNNSRVSNVESNVVLLYSGLAGANSAISTINSNLINFASNTVSNVNAVQSNLSSYTVYSDSRVSNVEANVTLLYSGLTGANSTISGVQTSVSILSSNTIANVNAVQSNLDILSSNTTSNVNTVQSNLTSLATLVSNITANPITFQSEVVVEGNLLLRGNTSIFISNTISFGDSLVSLGANNTTNDIIDIGIYGHYWNGSANSHAGLIRSYVSKDWMLFGNYTIDLAGNSTVNISDNSFALANLRLASANAISVYSSGVELRANDYTTYTTLTTNYSANDGVTLLSARSNDYSTYTTLTTNYSANDGVTLASARSNDYSTYTTLTTNYSANDGVTLASARSNDYTTYTTLSSAYNANDYITLSFAYSNDYSTYNTLNARINTVQGNIANASGSVDGIISANSNITIEAGYSIVPATDSLQDLGSSTRKFRTLYLSGNTLNLGETAISAGAGGSVAISGSNGAPVALVVSSLTIGPAENPVVLSTPTGGGSLTVTTSNTTVPSVLKTFNLVGSFVGPVTGVARYYPINNTSISAIQVSMSSNTSSLVVAINKNSSLLQTVTLSSGSYKTALAELYYPITIDDYITVDVNSGTGVNLAVTLST